ncbi:MAG: GAF domain-containing protein [Magnetococcales bacterium]|nr:GAF domain-containing protein [Magnetococcales bacterium]
MRLTKIARQVLIMLAGLIVIGVILGSGLTLVAKQNYAAMERSTRQQLESEVELLAQIVTNYLQTGEYQEVEVFLQNWGENQPDIIQITTTSKQGFSLGSYVHATKYATAAKGKTITASRTVTYSYEGSAVVLLVKDLQGNIKEVEKSLWQMGVAGGVILLFIFIVLLLARRLHLEASQLRSERANLKDTNDRLQLEMEKNSNMVKLQKQRLNLVDIISKERDTAKIAEEILQFLAQSADAQAGALFIVDKEGILQTVATLGRAKDESVNEQFTPGQGLPGQALVNKSPIFLDNVPNDYQPIFSSLVSGAPRYVLVFPFLYNERVVCVVELALIGDLKEEFKEYLNFVSDTVAIAILNSL